VVGKMWGDGGVVEESNKIPTWCFRSNVASLVEYQHIIPVFREHLEIQMPTSQLRSRDQKKLRQALLRDQPRGGMMQFFVGGGPSKNCLQFWMKIAVCQSWNSRTLQRQGRASISCN